MPSSGDSYRSTFRRLSFGFRCNDDIDSKIISWFGSLPSMDENKSKRHLQLICCRGTSSCLDQARPYQFSTYPGTSTTQQYESKSNILFVSIEEDVIHSRTPKFIHSSLATRKATRCMLVTTHFLIHRPSQFLISVLPNFMKMHSIQNSPVHI